MLARATDIATGLSTGSRWVHRMTMSERLTEWMRRYQLAWTTNDPGDIRSLFTGNARYLTDPFAAPWSGHNEIVAGWIGRRDTADEFTFEWAPLVETDELSIIEGTTDYPARTITYSNLWVIRWGADDRADEFTEWWMDQSDPS